MTKKPFYHYIIWLLCVAIFASLYTLASSFALADEKTVKLQGVWFTCEFAKRTTPPEDGCKMLDDEGFEVVGDNLSYLRNKWSDETACKGAKQGQCFSSDERKIKVTRKKVGKIEIDDGVLKVKYLFCTQHFNLTQEEGYVAVKPAAKKCPWATKRHFYVTRYTGRITTP